MTCLKSDINSIETAANILKNGGVTILPTDTVYGFSGIANPNIKNDAIDERIRKIKGRGEDKPFIVLISSPEEIIKYSAEKIPEKILQHWPGALTVIVKDLHGGTAAFRCPGDEWLRNVIEKCGCPISSTSVNRSGKPVLQNISEICAEFGNEVDLIVDDGDKPDAIPSTIVRVDSGKIEVIRQGCLRIEN